MRAWGLKKCAKGLVMSEFKLKENELESLCRLLKDSLHNGDIVLLQGSIGSGKTTFVRHFVESFGQEAQVSSPTFSLALSYENAQYGSIHHYDIYRKDVQEMLELGLLDMLMREGVHFIEWGEEKLKNLLAHNGFKVATITITPTPTHHRIYEVCL